MAVHYHDDSNDLAGDTMTFTAEVQIRHPDLLLTRTLESSADARVEREYNEVGADGERYAFVSVYATSFDAFEDRLSSDPTISESLLVGTFDDRRLYRLTLTDEVTILDPELASIGIALVEATGADGRWRYVLRVPDRDSLASFNDHCERRDVNLQVERLSRSSDDAATPVKPPLTDAQREALTAAHENGYFDEPRRTSLEQLATELGVSSTAVGGRIRRGTAKLIDAVLLSDESERE